VSSKRVIDNFQGNDLSRKLNEVLPDCISAKFGVGYFFLSGLKEIIDGVSGLEELRLLISNTTDQDTKEALLEAFKKIKIAEEESMKKSKLNTIQRQESVEDTKQNIKKSLEVMEQVESEEKIVNTFLKMLDPSKRQIKVKVLTTEKLHAKAYILKYKEGQLRRALGHDSVGIVGSSNLSMAGLKQSSELNLVTTDDTDNQHLHEWFDRLWEAADEFTDDLHAILENSWVKQEPTPHEVYVKGMYHEINERLGDQISNLANPFGTVGPDLFEFQLRAVYESVNILERYRGVIIGDVVGLGKTFVAAGVAKLLQMTKVAEPLIICPPVLESMWKDTFRRYQIKADFLSRGKLTDKKKIPLSENYEYNNHNLIIIDESHHFRHSESNQYENLKKYLDQDEDRKILLLTATPYGVSLDDLFNQIKLFHKTDTTEIPIGITSLKNFQRGVEKKTYRMQDILKHIMIRRTRKYILDTYGKDDPKSNRRYLVLNKKTQDKTFFPDRDLDNISYDIEKVYNKNFENITNSLSKDPTFASLTLARFGLGRYVKKDRLDSKKIYQKLWSNGPGLMGLMRILLLKRMESSIAAFRNTIHKIRLANEIFLGIVTLGKIPIGKIAQKIMYDILDDTDFNDVFDVVNDKTLQEQIATAFAELEQENSLYDINDFETDELKQDIKNDIEILKKIEDMISEQKCSISNDDKFDKLAKLLEMNNNEKILIFSEYADTAKYLYERLTRKFPKMGKSLEVVYSQKSSTKDQSRIIGRFAPDSNQKLVQELFNNQKLVPINTLVATDVVSEGTNLQDAGIVINYDIHWNLARIIQRTGRIDRIGQKRETIKFWNFLPDPKMDKKLGLQERVAANIEIYHKVIGSDDKILQKSEKLDPDGVTKLYVDKDEGVMDQMDENLDNSDTIEKKLSDLEQTDRDYYNRIMAMQDGIRTASKKDHDGTAVVIVAFQAGKFRKYYECDKDKNVKSILWNDMEKYLDEEKDAKRTTLPTDYNDYISAASKVFEKDLKDYNAGPRAKSFSSEQSWLLQNLKRMLGDTNLKQEQTDISRLFEIFREKIDDQWLIKDLRQLKRDHTNKVTTDLGLIDELTDLTTSTAKYLLKQKKNNLEPERDVPQILYSKYLEA